MSKWSLLGAVIFVLILSTPARANSYHKEYRHGHYGRYLALRHYHHLHRHWARRPKHMDYSKTQRITYSRSALPGPCHTAAAMGGPCGCWAEWILLGRLEHVLRDAIGTWNPWLADDWRRHYPRVAPHQATAVVWPGRHVAPIIPNTYRDGTIVVHDSWAVHRIRTTGLVFVQTPTMGRPRPSNIKVGAWPL